MMNLAAVSQGRRRLSSFVGEALDLQALQEGSKTESTRADRADEKRASMEAVSRLESRRMTQVGRSVEYSFIIRVGHIPDPVSVRDSRPGSE